MSSMGVGDTQGQPLTDVNVRVGAHSHRGARTSNEDYATWRVIDAKERASIGLAVALADGMGAYKGGRVAAETAARGFIEGLLGVPETLGMSRSSALALDAINRWIHATGRADAQLQGMACTLTALILCNRRAHVVHVGDTRVYRLRENQLTQLTTDHTLGAPGTTHALTRAVGAQDSLRADHIVETAREYDRYLLCSDGVHGPLARSQILRALIRQAAPEETARNLVEEAIAVSDSDNATAVVVDVLALPTIGFADRMLDFADQPLIPVPNSGAVIDGYELGSMVADGIHTRVFRATDRIEDRVVLIKFPKPRPGLESIQRMMLMRETWIASQVRSPFVTEALDPPVDRRSCVYAVLPYYEGESLERRLSRHPPVTLQAGVDISIKLAKAIAALHRAGIVHRDIKPDNIIVLPGGGVRLIDLGVARLARFEEPVTDDAPGTPSYKAPELFNAVEADESTDVFALGVALFRMFTAGKYPYGEIEPFSQPRFAHPAALTRYRPDLPAWLDHVLMRAVERDRSQRFADALELAFELEHGWVHGGPQKPLRQSLYDRNPIRFWQVVAALLAVALLFTASFISA